jgi:hypothetical protein
MTHIELTAHELRSGRTRQDWAEGLIAQLPAHHEGRNDWLMNYGHRAEAQALRNAPRPDARRRDASRRHEGRRASGVLTLQPPDWV